MSEILQIAPVVRVSAVKTEDPSSIPGTHTVGDENQLSKVVF